jgi:aryl-alcohol dehydrogenase-like predicted oxidoreductase
MIAEQRELGNAVSLPRLGFGGGSLFGIRGEREAGDVLEHAYTRGFRYFDTAPL